jgi:septum formation protein
MLILASASPRRRELLTQAGYTFQVHPAHIPEDPFPNEDPIAYVTRLAREKAQAVFRELALKGHGLSRAECDSKVDWALAPEGSLSETPTTPGTPEPVLRLPKDPDSETWESTNARASEKRASAALQVPSAAPQVVLGADTTVTLDNHILGKPESPADAARMLRLLSGRTHRVITGIALVTATSTRVAAEETVVQFLALSERDIAEYIATPEPMDKAGAYAIQGYAARWIPRIEGDYFNVVGLPIALVSTLLKSL